jgi:sugar phosphate isomerase/epimerase
MKLGFVSALFPDLSLEEVVAFAAAESFDGVELMCWPKGKAERRYAGVTHLEVTDFDRKRAAQVKQLFTSAGVAISALGYYPNPLSPNKKDAARVIAHLKQVILAAERLGVNVNTFVGRDWKKSVADNWPRFLEVWEPLLRFAEKHGVAVAIENCPMLFTREEWPGGKNLAVSPAVWRQMFAAFPSPGFGLNYDPSHLVWQQMDYLKPLEEFGRRIFHVHAKDVLIDRERLNDVGILATPLQYHQPKLPGRGEIDWPRFLAALKKCGYDGYICIEVEDRAYEATLADRKQALRQSGAFLRPLLPKSGNPGKKS